MAVTFQQPSTYAQLTLALMGNHISNLANQVAPAEPAASVTLDNQQTLTFVSPKQFALLKSLFSSALNSLVKFTETMRQLMKQENVLNQQWRISDETESQLKADLLAKNIDPKVADQLLKKISDAKTHITTSSKTLKNLETEITVPETSPPLKKETDSLLKEAKELKELLQKNGFDPKDYIFDRVDFEKLANHRDDYFVSLAREGLTSGMSAGSTASAKSLPKDIKRFCEQAQDRYNTLRAEMQKPDKVEQEKLKQTTVTLNRLAKEDIEKSGNKVNANRSEFILASKSEAKDWERKQEAIPTSRLH